MRAYGLSCDHCSYEGEVMMDGAPEVCPKCGHRDTLAVKTIPVLLACCGFVIDSIEADSGQIKDDAWCPKCGKWFHPAK